MKRFVEVRGVYVYKNDKLTLTPKNKQPRMVIGNDNETDIQIFDIKLGASRLVLSQDYTEESKFGFGKEGVWELMGIEKPEGFELVKSVRISTFTVA